MCVRDKVCIPGVCLMLLLVVGCSSDQELYTLVSAYGDSDSAAILQRRTLARLSGPTNQNYRDGVNRLKSLAADGQIVDAMMEGQYVVHLNELLRHRATMMRLPFFMERENVEHLVEATLEPAMKDPKNVDQVVWAAELHAEFAADLQKLVIRCLLEVFNRPILNPEKVDPTAVSEALVRYYEDNKSALFWDATRKVFVVRRPAFPVGGRMLPPGCEAQVGSATQSDVYPQRIICLKDGAEMVYVPPGRLKIKGASMEVGGFYIDRYVVTKEKFEKFCASTGLKSFVPSELAPTHPAVNVTLKEAMAYATWTGRALPNKSQWLRAACGDDPGHVPWVRRGVPEVPPPGERDEYAILERQGLELAKRMAKVGGREKGESPFGARDMIGNVNQILASEQRGIGEDIGGSFKTVWDYAKSPCYNWGLSWTTSDRYDDLGFRCVLPVP